MHELLNKNFVKSTHTYIIVIRIKNACYTVKCPKYINYLPKELNIKTDNKFYEFVYMINNAIHELEHEEFGNTIRGYNYNGIDYWAVIRTPDLVLLRNYNHTYKLIDISEDVLDLNLLVFDMLMCVGGILLY